MLKVVHLNTYDGNGGAGRACMRLNRALLSQNVDSKVIVHYKFGKNPQIGTFNRNPVQKAYAAATIILERILAKRYLKPLSRTPFSFTWFGRSVIRHPEVKNADIIHLHWINHGFLDPKHIAEIAKLNKPVVWTFHDSNAFTGGCHVRYACDHYMRECGNCPLLIHEGDNDISRKIWQQKRKAYDLLDFTVAAPSSWMQASVKNSSLMQGKVVNNIPNTLETDIFKPANKKQAKQKAGLPTDKFIFLSGFMPSRKDLHKGTQYLLDSLELLRQRMEADADKIELVIFGNRGTEGVPDFPFKTSFLGTINNDKQLAQYYAARNDRGRVIMYADKITDSMQITMDETNRRRDIQIAYNTERGITPITVGKSREEIMEQTSVVDFQGGVQKAYVEADSVSLAADPIVQYMTKADLKKSIDNTKKDMLAAAKDMDFLLAAKLRDEMFALEKMMEEKF